MLLDCRMLTVAETPMHSSKKSILLEKNLQFLIVLICLDTCDPEGTVLASFSLCCDTSLHQGKLKREWLVYLGLKGHSPSWEEKTSARSMRWPVTVSPARNQRWMMMLKSPFPFPSSSPSSSHSFPSSLPFSISIQSGIPVSRALQNTQCVGVEGGLVSSVKLLWKHPHRHTHMCVS